MIIKDKLKIKPCPKCKSTRITMKNTEFNHSRWIIECRNCKHGIVVDGKDMAIKVWEGEA